MARRTTVEMAGAGIHVEYDFRDERELKAFTDALRAARDRSPFAQGVVLHEFALMLEDKLEDVRSSR